MYWKRRPLPLEPDKRIWELDALRGLSILGMVIIHFVYDLVELYGMIRWNYPPFFTILRDWGGVAFLLISGICVTLGSRNVRRGLIVLGCGLLISAVTAGMYRLGLADRSVVISFGILHCLGICMLLWPVFRRVPVRCLAVLGAVIVVLGYGFQKLTVESPFLFWLGLVSPGFVSADFFPLMPNLGYFLLGAFLGKTLYRRKETLLPQANSQNPILRFFSGCGRHSLLIYLLHQPALVGIITIISPLFPNY